MSRTADAPPAVPGDDELVPIDPARLDSLSAVPPQVARTEPNRRGRLFSDSMSLSKVCWTAAVLPGYGQIYNKQYWKLPILYGTLGAGIGLFIHENNTYRPLKRAYDEMVDRGLGCRSPAFETIQERMIRSNTRRQLYLGAPWLRTLFHRRRRGELRHQRRLRREKPPRWPASAPAPARYTTKATGRCLFVVGGFAAMIYCIDWNNRGYQRFKTAYARRARYENDPTSYTGPLTGDMSIYKPRRSRPIRTATAATATSASSSRPASTCSRSSMRTWTPTSSDYDISDDLSMDLEPMVDYPYVPGAGGHRPVFGFNLNFNFSHDPTSFPGAVARRRLVAGRCRRPPPPRKKAGRCRDGRTRTGRTAARGARSRPDRPRARDTRTATGARNRSTPPKSCRTTGRRSRSTR